MRNQTLALGARNQPSKSTNLIPLQTLTKRSRLLHLPSVQGLGDADRSSPVAAAAPSWESSSAEGLLGGLFNILRGPKLSHRCRGCNRSMSY